MDDVHPSQSFRTVHIHGGSSRNSKSLLAMASLLNLLSTRPPPLFWTSKKHKIGAQIPHFTARSAYNSENSSHLKSRFFSVPSASNSHKSSHRLAGRERIDETTSQISRRSTLAAVVAGTLCGTTAIKIPSACGSEEKQTNLNVEQVKAIIEDDIIKGQYYITGNLSPSIYNDNCRFTDPTTVVTGVQKYVAAVKLLFDPDLSQQELLSIDVVGPRTIEANWRLGGYLKFPWKPHIMPYEGSTRYTLGDDGLVVSHDEKWSISLLTALLELFTPSWGPH